MIKNFDGFLTEEDKEYIQETIKKPIWQWGHASIGGSDKLFWQIKFLEKDVFYSEHLINKIKNLTGDDFSIERIYMNGHTACSSGEIHTDSPHDNGRTFLIYCNEQWNPEFGGSTCFLMDNTIGYSYPAPYSAVYFQNNINHFAMPLNRHFNGLRVTLAFKLYKK